MVIGIEELQKIRTKVQKDKNQDNNENVTKLLLYLVLLRMIRNYEMFNISKILPLPCDFKQYCKLKTKCLLNVLQNVIVKFIRECLLRHLRTQNILSRSGHKKTGLIVIKHNLIRIKKQQV